MHFIPVLRIKTFESITKSNLNVRYSENFFKNKCLHNSGIKTNLSKCKMSEEVYIEKKWAWIKSFLTLENNSGNKFIKDLNKAGLGILKTIPLPSSEEESYRFIPLDKLFNKTLVRSKRTEKFVNPYNFHINSREIWVYFINGFFSEKYVEIFKLPKDFYLGPFTQLSDEQKKKVTDLSNKGESGINGGFFSALNAACLEEITVLLIPENAKFNQNINIVLGCNQTDSEFYLNQKLIIIGANNSISRIVQYHIGTKTSEYFENTTVSIILQENAKIKYGIINQIPELSSQVTSIHVEVNKNSSFQFSSALFGGFFSRINLGIDINGINSKVDIKGISFAAENKTVDFHSRISHNYPECISSQLYKNLVFEKGHAIFAGKIQVHSGSFNTESEQLCKTLLFSPTSKIDAMPILEINNDNVKCTHGSTVSDLDKNQIFYFQSRGISPDIARKLLTSGFIKDIISTFPHIFQNIFLDIFSFIKL